MTELTDPADDLERAVRLLLAEHGPLPVAEIIERVDPSLLAYLRDEGVPEDELGGAVIEDVVVSDDLWATATDIVALTGPLLDGAVFTHRLTEDEHAQGAVLITPDLALLTWHDYDGIDTAGGRLRRVDGPHVPGESFATLEGPPGWLDRFAPGDLLTFALRSGTVTVDAVAPGDLAPDDALVDVLRTAAERGIAPGGGEEADPILLDAMATDPDAFRTAARPVGELMEAAGFERRGFSFGRAGQEWSRGFERLTEQRRARAVADWRLDTCCIDALDAVFAAFDGLDASGEVPDAPTVADALLHGDVADAFAEAAIGAGPDPTMLTVIGFADAVARAVPPRLQPGALVVLALALERLGNSDEAEAALRAARAADAEFGPAAAHLVDYEIDRNALGAALTLLRHPEVPSDPDEIEQLESFRRDLDGLHRKVGRNDPCPCGSGRKFKQCCQNKGAPLADRIALLSYKLVRHAMRSAQTRVVGVASAAVDDDDPDPVLSLRRFAFEPFIVDLALFEDGIAADYLKSRQRLLPADEFELLARLIEAPRRLCEITGVERGVSLNLRDAKTGETFVLSERAGSVHATVGELLLLRLARVGDAYRSFGTVIDIPLRLRASVLELCDADPPPDAEEFAAWFGSTPDIGVTPGVTLS